VFEFVECKDDGDWQHGVINTLVLIMQLLYIGPGYCLDGWLSADR